MGKKAFRQPFAKRLLGKNALRAKAFSFIAKKFKYNPIAKPTKPTASNASGISVSLKRTASRPATASNATTKIPRKSINILSQPFTGTFKETLFSISPGLCFFSQLPASKTSAKSTAANNQPSGQSKEPAGTNKDARIKSKARTAVKTRRGTEEGRDIVKTISKKKYIFGWFSQMPETEKGESEKNIGAVLNIFAEVEYWLDTFLSLYFIKGLPENKAKLLEDWLDGLSFEGKKQLFSKVCEVEGYTKSSLFEQAISAMTSIQRVRNNVAHRRKYWDAEKGVASKFGRSKLGEPELILDENFINELSCKCHKAISCIGIFMNKMQGNIADFD